MLSRGGFNGDAGKKAVTGTFTVTLVTEGFAQNFYHLLIVDFHAADNAPQYAPLIILRQSLMIPQQAEEQLLAGEIRLDGCGEQEVSEC